MGTGGTEINRFLLLAAGFFCLGLLGSCTHAAPVVVQVFNQVNHVYDPAAGTWSDRLSVFLQGSSADGNKVFDRLHVIQDDAGCYFTLDRGSWTVIDRPGEFWVGANNLSFPDGQVPQGTWRTVLVTRTGQKVEVPFTLSPQPPGVPPALSGTVTVKVDPQNSLRFQVTGWVEDYLVWARDSQGLVMARVKNTGNWFTVPGGTSLVTLYSYDKARGIGLEAGPFPVQNLR